MLPRFDDFLCKKSAIAIVGLGYVGLPLAVALAKHFRVIGFDLSHERVARLQSGQDSTLEVDSQSLSEAALDLSADPQCLRQAALIIIAVPTPIDLSRRPDLTALLSATRLVGEHMRENCLVVYESTVYPGVTEEECVPLLEAVSGKLLNSHFWVAYSPERINPGDKTHTIENIVKVVAATSSEALDLLADIYSSVVLAGVYKASSIKVAEAAKVIENTQRDLNIALMNELALIFDRLGIDSLDVLKAAGTKWNFLPFKPGLVGGHCIGVDPYYLTHKAETVGYFPQIILAGRRINDGMGKFVAEKTIKLLLASGACARSAKIGIFGLAFKENVPDLRNSRVIDIYNELKEYGVGAFVHDPLVDAHKARQHYDLCLQPLNAMHELDAAIFAVAHDCFAAWDLAFVKKLLAPAGPALLVDVKGLWFREEAIALGLRYWRL